jgi:hypothetical protein
VAHSWLNTGSVGVNPTSTEALIRIRRSNRGVMIRRIAMTTRFCMTLLTVGLLAGTAFDASAAGVNTRQARQHTRIHAGIAQGDLTRHEAAALHAQQARIGRVEGRLRADDGALGPYERARLQEMQDRASRSIHRQRHDAQRR